MYELNTSEVILPAIVSHCLCLTSVRTQLECQVSQWLCCLRHMNHIMAVLFIQLFNKHFWNMYNMPETVLAMGSKMRKNIITALKELMI